MLWLTRAAGLRKILLAGSFARFSGNQRRHRTHLRVWRIFLWRVGITRPADRSLGRFVGALSDICWVIRGISVPRLQSIYVEFRRRLLARCQFAFAAVCGGAFGK